MKILNVNLKKVILTLLLMSAFLPYFLFAQNENGVKPPVIIDDKVDPVSARGQSIPDITTVGELNRIEKVFNGLTLIFDVLIVIGVSLAFLYFFWGIAEFIRKTEDAEKAKNKMFWGLIALFVLTSVWGIVFALNALILGTNRGDTAIQTFYIPFQGRPIDNSGKNKGQGLTTDEEGNDSGQGITTSNIPTVPTIPTNPGEIRNLIPRCGQGSITTNCSN